MAELAHLRATVRRQSTPGSVAILVCALIVFGPKLYDTIIGEPWIDNTLTIVENSNGEVVVEDLTLTNDTVYGLRVNTVEDTNGNVICSTEHHNSWFGERKRFWQYLAFTGCPTEPSVSFRACSLFSIASDSGRQRMFGPFCSGYVTGRPSSSS